MRYIPASVLLIFFCWIAIAFTQNYPNPFFLATGGTTARDIADRANDSGFSVLEKGAVCNGTTDDTIAIQNALNSGNTRVTIPAGKKCYSATGVTVPLGVTLAGMSFASGNASNLGPSGSELLCAANVSACLTVGGSTSGAGAQVKDLIVATNNSSAPTSGKCIYIDSGNQVILTNVMAYNCFDGYYWYNGLGGVMDHAFSGKIADAHVVQDSWVELHISLSRFGMNGGGDLTTPSYIKITATNSANGGPNTLISTNNQYNQGGGAPVVNWIQFVGCAATSGCDAAASKFIGDHVENLSGAAIMSDATWTTLNYIELVGNTFGLTTPFLSLNSATGIYNSHFIGNRFSGSSFSYSPSGGFGGFVLDGNTFEMPVTFTSGNANSDLTLGTNHFYGDLTLGGAWSDLTVGLQDFGSGSLVNNATGTVKIAVPSTPQPILYNVPGGYTYTLPPWYGHFRVLGCGWGGPGGSGAVQVSTGTSSGGASGGPGFCQDITYPRSALSTTIGVSIGSAPVPGAAVTASAATAGNTGTQGGNTTVSTGSTRLMTLWPGGVGAGGQLGAASGAGGAAGFCGPGGNASGSTNGAAGCGGNAGGSGGGTSMVGPAGNGSSSVGVASGGGAAFGIFNAGSGGAGGGTDTTSGNNGGGGGRSMGSAFLNAAGGISTSPNGGSAAATALDVPGPGGAGGYGGEIATAGNGGAGSQGDGGGGGGSCTAASGTCTSGAGGQGGTAFVEIIPLP